MKSKVKNRWRLEAGRGLLLNGKPVLTFQRYGNIRDGYTLDPWQADRLSHRIVAALNAADRQRREKRQKRDSVKRIQKWRRDIK